MKRMMKTLTTVTSLMLIGVLNASAGGAGTSGGLTLIEPFGARPASLGEAFSAVKNDVAAFGYNPASLRSLESGQASFMYQKGLAEDSYGQFIMGSPMKNGSLGLSVGYYNGGTLDLFDGVKERTVTAQKDMSVALGYAVKLGGLSLGVTGKYLSSELAETAKATAYAADLGMQMGISDRLTLGAAVQNLGTQLKFVEEGDNLPRIARLGASFVMFPGRYRTSLMAEAPYYLNEKEVRPSLGLETMVGPLAFRAGLKGGGGMNEFSLGTGFMLGKSSLDYSFGMANQLDATHRVSMSMKFGGAGSSNDLIAKRQVREIETAQVPQERGMKETAKLEQPKNSLGSMTASANVATFSSRNHQIYVVQEGDTLGRIAKKMYGDSREWKRIYTANRHLIDDSKSIEIGQKIVLP